MIQHILQGDGRTRQQGSAPAESRREGDWRVFLFHQRVEQQLVETAVEIATAIQQAVGRRQFFGEPAFVGCAVFLQQRGHVRIRRQQIGEHRQQLVAEARHLAGLHVEIQHAEELAVGAGVGHQRGATTILHRDGRGNAIVCMPAQNGVQSADARGQFEIDIHAVVRQQHHDLRALAARLVDGELEILFLDAIRPIRHEITRIGDGAVGERLADDGHRDAVHFLDDVRLEHGVAKVGGLDVLRNDVHLALQ